MLNFQTKLGTMCIENVDSDTAIDLNQANITNRIELLLEYYNTKYIICYLLIVLKIY